MNEIFDRLLIRILLVAIVLGVLAAYKAGHVLFYPSLKSQVRKRFFPSVNPADTLHMFTRLGGFAIVLSSLGFDESHGVLLSLFHLLVWGTLTAVLYLLSLLLVESMVLYNFDYKDEVLKRANMSYALVCAAHALSIAYVIRVVVDRADNSLVILFVLWLLAMVVMGFGTKYYAFLTRLPVAQLASAKHPSLAVSYFGFTLGLGWLVGESFSQEHFDITVYCVQVLLKVMLSLIVFPLFRRGVHRLFPAVAGTPDAPGGDPDSQGWGHGIYEAAVFLTAAVLTSLIVNHIQFGTIYPFF